MKSLIASDPVSTMARVWSKRLFWFHPPPWWKYA